MTENETAIRLLQEWISDETEKAEVSMTDLELAILNILIKSQGTPIITSALTLTDLQAFLIQKGFATPDILPRAITDALITLEDKGLIRNELSWHALPPAETKT